MEKKLEQLRKILKQMKNVAIGFSGGVDSTFLAKVAIDTLGTEQVLCITFHESFHARSEIEDSIAFMQEMGGRHKIVKSNLIEEPFMRENTADRCYYCKKAIFSKIINIASKEGDYIIVDGTNKDDDLDYRPGMRALKELGIRSPLKEAGLIKLDIRTLSKELNLPTWNHPAMACLASRIPYGDTISSEKLRQIEEAEKVIKDLGFTQYRVRHHGTIARIEILKDEMHRILESSIMNKIETSFTDLGFKYVALDLKGYQMGNMNI